MFFSPCRAWAPLFLSSLERQATASLRYLPPDHTCAIDYPTKLKPTGSQSRIYSRIHTAANQRPSYSVEVAIVGCYREGKFLEATFVVPSLVPSTPLQEYGVEYDTSLEVYIVQHTSLQMSESRNRTDTKTPTEEQVHIEDWFDSESIILEEDEDWESHAGQNDVSAGVFLVENFPVMSRKVCDVRHQQSPDLTASVSSREDQDLEFSGYQSLGSSKETTASQTTISPEEEKVAGLVDLDSFNWADEVEEEEETTACPITNNPAPEKEANLLNYESFNWADDAEEEDGAPSTQEPAQKSEIFDLLKQDDFNWAEEFENEVSSPSKKMGNIPERELPRYEIFDWSEESDVEESAVAEETNGNGAATHALSQSPPERPMSPVPGASNPSSAIDVQEIAETGVTESGEDYQEVSELSMEVAVMHHNNVSRMEWECYFQDNQARDYPHLHHFNWLGYGVVEPSETPAEVSLAVILSGPKTWLCGNPTSPEVVTLSQAFRYVDPVLYEGDVDALYLRGSELQKAVTGSASKFYTSYGTWIGDTYGGDEERPFIDPMDVDFYGALASFPVNGWYDKGMVPTRDGELCKFQNHTGRSAWDVAEKKGQPYRMSALRNAWTDGEEEASSQCERSLRVVRGKMQYWTHEERQIERLPGPEEEPEPEVILGDGPVKVGATEGSNDLDDKTPANDRIEETYCGPPDDPSAHSRPSSSDGSHTLSDLTAATSVDGEEGEITPPTDKTAIPNLRRRKSVRGMASETKMMDEKDPHAQPQTQDPRISLPSLVLPPLAVLQRQNRPHSTSHSTPSPNRKPGYTRLRPKSEPVQASLSDSSKKVIPEFYPPGSGMQVQGAKESRTRIWKPAWWRKVLKFSRWKTPVPQPPPPPPMDAAQFLRLCIRG